MLRATTVIWWHQIHWILCLQFKGILPKGPYPPCLRMADRALLAGYPRIVQGWNKFISISLSPAIAQVAVHWWRYPTPSPVSAAAQMTPIPRCSPWWRLFSGGSLKMIGWILRGRLQRITASSWPSCGTWTCTEQMWYQYGYVLTNLI